MQVRTAPELYAHAIAIEREAAERYAELAQRMDDLGNVALAQLFAQLGGFEAEHLQALLSRAEGVDLPAVDAGEYAWLYSDAPETPAREFVFRLMTPHHALGIALTAERRAQAFFEHVLMTAEDPALRALAREMAAEEQEHVGIIERLLERTPASFVDWGAVFDAREVKQKGSPDV